MPHHGLRRDRFSAVEVGQHVGCRIASRVARSARQNLGRVGQLSRVGVVRGEQDSVRLAGGRNSSSMCAVCRDRRVARVAAATSSRDMMQGSRIAVVVTTAFPSQPGRDVSPRPVLRVGWPLWESRYGAVPERVRVPSLTYKAGVASARCTRPIVAQHLVGELGYSGYASRGDSGALRSRGFAPSYQPTPQPSQ